MVKFLSLLTLLTGLTGPVCFGQYTQRTVGSYAVFTLPFEGDSVTFAVVTDKDGLKKRKPIFLFRQGSLPIPLFVISPKTNKLSLTQLPISCYDHEADFYSITIAKPGIPLIVEDTYLDTLFRTRNNPKPAMYPPDYQAHNYLDYYVRQTSAVLDFVLKQPWADIRRVVLCGGSEGYEVAIKTAYTNPKITHLIAFSGSLDGRQQGIIREERMKGYTGEYTPEEAQRSVEGLQQQWAEICRDSSKTTARVGDPPRTTYSFSHDRNKEYLLALTIPILISYGTADVASASNDVLPLEFTRRGKQNLTLKAYPNHDHTFYKLTYDKAVHVIGKVYNGVAVERDYFQWLKEH